MKDKEIFIRILSLVKPHRKRLLIAMLSMVFVSVLTSGQAYIIKPLMDKMFLSKDREMLNLIPFALVGLFLVKGVFYYCYSYMMERVGHTIIAELRKKLFSHMQILPISFFQKTPTGELISRVISDVLLLQSAVSTALIGILKDLFSVIGLLTVLFYMNWKLALFSLIYLQVTIIPIVHFGRKYRQLSTQCQEKIAQTTSILHETIPGNRIIKAFLTEKREINRFSQTVDQLLGITIRDIQVRSLSHPIMELLGGLGIALILWYGGRQVLNGAATPGTFLSFLAALIMVYEPIKKVSNINSTVQQGVASAIRVFNVLDQKPETEHENALNLPELRREITFDNVSFRYDDKTEVLKNINLHVKAGEILAIVGPSGGGKTTLVNLIPRFFDATDGQILIDNHNIREATFTSLRRQIAMVTQQTILFNDTVRNNISYGSPDSSENEIIAAAQAAYALDFIDGLPDGFNTIIGESGSRLSGGQRQRIAIARAILKNAPILVLDEATSALDTESEREVQKALENLMKNRTTFVIAHRLSTIRSADKIIVMENGRIAEQGTHEYLLNQKGLYETLHTMQFTEPL